MISVIICSRHSSVSSSLLKNIEQTIGTSYEVICIDNSLNQYSIFQAYNEGVRRSNFEYLCFIHEDILFRTNNWGAFVISSFQNDNKVGMLGVFGGFLLLRSSFYWFSSGFQRGGNLNTINGKTELRRHLENEEFGNDVVAADGMFLAIKKDLFNNKIRWDEDYFDGFHFYDMDISMQILSNGYKIRIIPEIVIEHFSDGCYNKKFYENCEKFHKKWDSILPVSTIPLTDHLLISAEKKQMEENYRHAINSYDSHRRLLYWPYKIATKISLLLGYNVWG